MRKIFKLLDELMSDYDEIPGGRIRLPEGQLHYLCCADCKYGDYNSKYDEVYCGYHRKWFPKSDWCTKGEYAD